MVAADDPGQRSVAPVAPDLVGLGVADRGQIPPCGGDRRLAEGMAQRYDGNSPFILRVEGGVSLTTKVVAERRESGTIGVHQRIRRLPPVESPGVAPGSPREQCAVRQNSEDDVRLDGYGSGVPRRARRRHLPCVRIGWPAQRHRPAVRAGQVEDGGSALLRVPGDHRVPGPRTHGGERPELSGPIALARPRAEVVAIRVEHQQFVRAAVGDHDPSVGEPGRVADPVELEGVRGVAGADGHDGLLSDDPPQACTGCRCPVLDDRDPCAVANLVLQRRSRPGVRRFRVGPRLTCGDGHERNGRHDSQGSASLHVNCPP